jgi:hypothetical protein
MHALGAQWYPTFARVCVCVRRVRRHTRAQAQLTTSRCMQRFSSNLLLFFVLDLHMSCIPFHNII